MEGELLIGGLRCAEVLEKLDSLVDGTLEAESHRAVVEHVAGCDRCERFGGTYAEVVRRIRGAARIDEPEMAVLERLRARLGHVGQP